MPFDITTIAYSHGAPDWVSAAKDRPWIEVAWPQDGPPYMQVLCRHPNQPLIWTGAESFKMAEEITFTTVCLERKIIIEPGDRLRRDVLLGQCDCCRRVYHAIEPQYRRMLASEAERYEAQDGL